MVPTDDADAQQFGQLLAEIDELLDQYSPGDLRPERLVADVFRERAAQRGLFERAIQLVDEGLERFPRNGELLRRRAWALCRIVTDDLAFPFVAEAERDLRTILQYEPNNLRPALDLAQELFTFDGFEDADVVDIANELGDRAQSIMLEARALQVRAMVHAEQEDEARALAKAWLKLFPDDEDLAAAAKEIGPPRSS